MATTRPERRRHNRKVRKAGDQLIGRIKRVRSDAQDHGWDDVVVELDQAEHFATVGDGDQARRHVEEAARLFARRRYEATDNGRGS